MKKLKLYIETSVWGYLEDMDAPEKRRATEDFFAVSSKGIYSLFISEIVAKELFKTPDPKRAALIKKIDEFKPEILSLDAQINELANAYIAERILSESKLSDALHVAIATVNELDGLVSWNYRHLANITKKERFNGVNKQFGFFKELHIVTPWEVRYEEPV